MDSAKGYKLYKDIKSNPQSGEGRKFLQGILGEGVINSFPFSLPAGVQRTPDYHSVDCVAFVQKGALQIGFGENFQDQIEAVTGDYLFIGKKVLHKEGTKDDEGMELELFYIGKFEVFGTL